jgi:hypothetical protein
MNKLMKRPNKRGREDFKNAISDDLETQNFRAIGGATWESGHLILSSWFPE